MLLINEFQNQSFFTFFISAVIVVSIMLIFGWILGGKSISRHKHTPFESGIVSVGSVQECFSVKFYLVAIFFVLFDVEASYLYLWSISVIENGWLGFVEVVFFISFLLFGLIYVISSGLLHWEPKTLPKN